MSKSKKMKKPLKIALIIISVILGLCVLALGICMIPCKTEAAAASALVSNEEITVKEINGGTAFVPKEPSAGVIFYPGARVQAKAYAPLMKELAENNILAISLDIPFNLAFFDINGADGVKEQFPDVKTWYIGGHSLGASVSGMYLEKHIDEFDGIILFAGFITNDLSKTNLKAISIYGSNDGILTGGLYDDNLKNLPKDFNEFVIDGGNHAGFAYYGKQSGDNEATIPKDTQIKLTAKYIAENIGA